MNAAQCRFWTSSNANLSVLLISGIELLPSRIQRGASHNQSTIIRIINHMIGSAASIGFSRRSRLSRGSLAFSCRKEGRAKFQPRRSLRFRRRPLRKKGFARFQITRLNLFQNRLFLRDYLAHRTSICLCLSSHAIPITPPIH
jgi:hypothetical protein